MKTLNKDEMNYKKLFNYMKDEHGVTLLESDMHEIENIVLEQESEQCNIPDVSGSVIPFVHSDNLRDEVAAIFNKGEEAALIYSGERDGEEVDFQDWFEKHYR